MKQKKKKGRKIISFLLTLAMVFSMLTGIMPGAGLISLARVGKFGNVGELHQGDILGHFVGGYNASFQGYITLQAGGYIDENGNVGQSDLLMPDGNYTYNTDDNDNHNTFYDYTTDHTYRPYANGKVARYWIVVSASGYSYDGEATLTGYDPGQSNNPFTENVIYRRYSTDGKPLADGTLSANVGIKVESDTLTWYNGNTYVVSDEVTISDRIKVIGKVNLILLDGAKLTANEGISVNGSEYSGAGRKTLNIYAGSTSDTILGTGQLIADARNCDWDWDCAGLGGDDGKAGGVLNIYGGVITAYGKEHGAGIGGGEGNYHNDITIYGGTISAYGGVAEYDNEAGAGIGSGYHGGIDYSGMGNVKIYGGSVTAVGGKGAAGIGGGAEAYYGGDNVYVYGGTVVATGAAGKEGIGKGSGEGNSGNLTLGCVKLETSTDNENWTEATDTVSRTQYMKITPVPHDLAENVAVAATCTTAGNSAYWKCNRCGKYFSDAEGLNEIAENSWVIQATGHNLSYSADDDTITATCSNSECELAEGVSLSVIAPEEPIFDGSSKEAHISTGYDTTVFPYVSEITYTKDNVALTGAPVDVGTYVASVNVGASESNCKTASVTYTILPASMTVDASDVNVEYDGNPHGISVNVSKPETGSTVIFGREEETYDLSESPTITDVSDSPFTVYYKVTADNYEDYTGSAKVTITNASQTAPDAPAMDSATATSITLTNVTGCEYSKDGSTWQTSNIFTGLTPDTTYTFYQRKAAVTNYNASLASPGADFSTNAHVHGFSYTADGDTITATCNDNDGCPLADSDYKATLTISANGGTYDGITSYEATVADENSIKGDAVVNYYKATDSGERGEALSPLTTAPANAGRYWAEITLGTGEDAKTAHVVYTIEKAAETAPAADTNQLNINYPDEIISSKSGYEVASDDNGTEITDFSSILDETTPTVYIRKTASDDNHAPSDWVPVTLSSRPAAPTGLGSTNATDGASEDGTITGVSETMEYSADGTNWTSVNGTTITGLKSGTYKVRVKATEGDPCGNAADVTVGSNYKALDETVSVIIKKGDSAIGDTVPVVDDELTADCEASNIIYQWYRDDEPIDGATERTYTLTKDDVGKAITVQVIQTKKADGTNYGENDRPKKMSGYTEAVVKKDGPDAPVNAQVAEFVPDYSAETFTIGEGYEVSSSDSEDEIITGNSLTDVIDGTRKIYIRVKETEDTKAGAWLEVTLTSRPDAPTGLGSTNATDGASKDGTITGVNDTMEYSADGTNWTSVNGTTITDLNAGTYKVRVKATEDKPAGEIAEVTVGSRKLTLTDRQKPTEKTNLKYNGSDQALLDAPVDGLPDGAVEIIYAIGENTDTAPEPDADGTPDDQKRWLTSIPTATDAGTYYVWYKVVGDENHNDVEPKCLVVTINEKQQTSNGTISTTGIYCASNYPAIQAGMVIEKSNEEDTVEYRWVACDTREPLNWFEVSPWTKDNNWMNWEPEKSGAYVVVCYARVVGNEEASLIQAAFGTEYHKGIKGICQMPYTGNGGGYLIGIESFDNPNNSYRYEMSILDCTLLAQGKDAWIYSTGKCGAQGNCLWTVWQPQYGYYWTLFRVYDAKGNLLDERCFGFANVY